MDTNIYKEHAQFEKQYFKVILESLPHPFYVIDAADQSIIFANKPVNCPASLHQTRISIEELDPFI